MKFALLQTLYTAPERIFFHGWLMEPIYPDNRVVADRTIDSHVKKRRHKLAELLPDRELIQAVYGVGYRDENNGTPRGPDKC